MHRQGLGRVPWLSFRGSCSLCRFRKPQPLFPTHVTFSLAPRRPQGGRSQRPGDVISFEFSTRGWHASKVAILTCHRDAMAPRSREGMEPAPSCSENDSCLAHLHRPPSPSLLSAVRRLRPLRAQAGVSGPRGVAPEKGKASLPFPVWGGRSPMKE